jgi:hypothetical protein
MIIVHQLQFNSKNAFNRVSTSILCKQGQKKSRFKNESGNDILNQYFLHGRQLNLLLQLDHAFFK